MKKKSIHQKTNYNPKLIFIRYILIIILILFFLNKSFSTPLSIILTKISYYFLKTFTQVTLINNQITFPDGSTFLIIKECIASSAYILISIIFLSIPINPKITYKPILKSYLIFTIFNTLRIFLLMTIHIKLGQTIFDLIHIAFYEFISGIGVAIIIIYYLKKLKIKKIYPFYSDIIYLISQIKKKKNTPPKYLKFPLPPKKKNQKINTKKN